MECIGGKGPRDLAHLNRQLSRTRSRTRWEVHHESNCSVLFPLWKFGRRTRGEKACVRGASSGGRERVLVGRGGRDSTGRRFQATSAQSARTAAGAGRVNERLGGEASGHALEVFLSFDVPPRRRGCNLHEIDLQGPPSLAALNRVDPKLRAVPAKSACKNVTARCGVTKRTAPTCSWVPTVWDVRASRNGRFYGGPKAAAVREVVPKGLPR